MDDTIEVLDSRLVLRHARSSDVAVLAEFNAVLHAESGLDADPAVRTWTRELFEIPHPRFRPEDCVIVETSDGTIVSTLLLISQTWSYEGVPFDVGRVELVATAPAYRNQGLVRRQMEVVHSWSAERGELAQVITGIPWYYRQFGYEFALGLGHGRASRPGDLPDAPPGITVRAATSGDDDLAQLELLDERAAARGAVGCRRSRSEWRRELERPADSVAAVRALIIADDSGGPIGAAVYRAWTADGTVLGLLFEIEGGRSWLEPSAALLRSLDELGRGLNDVLTGAPNPLAAVRMNLRPNHPFYATVRSKLPIEYPADYGLYVRVPDVAAFVRHVTPALDARLAASIAAGFNGTLTIATMPGALMLTWVDGRLSEVATPEPAPSWEEADAVFAGHTLLHVLLGDRSVAEQCAAHADVSVANDRAAVVLDAIFPKRPSNAPWPLG